MKFAQFMARGLDILRSEGSGTLGLLVLRGLRIPADNRRSARGQRPYLFQSKHISGTMRA